MGLRRTIHQVAKAAQYSTNLAQFLAVTELTYCNMTGESFGFIHKARHFIEYGAGAPLVVMPFVRAGECVVGRVGATVEEMIKGRSTGKICAEVGAGFGGAGEAVREVAGTHHLPSLERVAENAGSGIFKGGVHGAESGTAYGRTTGWREFKSGVRDYGLPIVAGVAAGMLLAYATQYYRR